MTEIIIECKDDFTENERNDLNTFLNCHETIKEKWTCFTNPTKIKVTVKIAKMIDDKILQEGIKHDNTMFSIKKEVLEYFHQLYDFKIDFLKELKSNFSD